VAGEGRVIATDAAPQALRPELVSGRRRLPLAWIATVPFFAYTVAFLFLPAASVIIGAFKSKTNGWTSSNVTTLFHDPYRHAYWVSIEVSGITAFFGGLIGFLVAYAMIRENTPKVFRNVITTFSGVAANFGGIPLAFAWIATIGPLGIATVFLRNHLHYDISEPGRLSLFSKTGIEFVYLYFQIPLAILVIAPAIDGLKREWREAASNLGANPWQFWRYVGVPVLAPSMLGMFILLFGNAFAAYATAYALTTGVIPLVPILIGYYYTGNVLDNPHLAQAMAFGMFVVLAVMMLLYIPLQRRSARWAK
jgi:putative spermidine/putrescine transport system permease protein